MQCFQGKIFSYQTLVSFNVVTDFVPCCLHTKCCSMSTHVSINYRSDICDIAANSLTTGLTLGDSSTSFLHHKSKMEMLRVTT